MISTPGDTHAWVGAMISVSGRTVPVTDLQPEDVYEPDIAHALGMICRYNGHVPRFYSVAEHCVRVAEMLRSWGEPSHVVLTGLVHDAHEALTGDMIRPLKRTAGLGEEFLALEAKVAEVVTRSFGGLWPHPGVVEEADRAVYYWEEANVRSGVHVGLSPVLATVQWRSQLALLMPF